MKITFVQSLISQTTVTPCILGERQSGQKESTFDPEAYDVTNRPKVSLKKAK